MEANFNSQILSFSSVMAEIELHRSSLKMRSISVKSPATKGKKVIEIQRGADNEISVGVKNHLHGPIGFLYQVLHFKDDETDLICYFLANYPYGFCHMTTSKGLTHLAVYQRLILN